MIDNIRGLSFPFQIENGCVVGASGAEKLKQNIKHILLTGVGERVMRRDYGGGIRELVHDPNNDALRAIVQHQIGKSIGQWEPRVLLQEVALTQRESTVFVDLRYIIRQTQEVDGVSVPVEGERA